MAESTGRVIDGFGVHAGHFRRVTGRDPAGVLELGPGDSVARALCVAASGLGPCWLVDAGDYAVEDAAHYRSVAEALAARGLAPPVLPAGAGRAAVLAACGARYLTTGLAGMRAVPAGSVDLILSDAVVEHLPLADFDGFLAAMFRVLRPGGIASHARVARAGFYTNRLRYPEILRRAEAAGFTVEVPWIERWPALPLEPRAMAAPFRTCPAEMLGIAVFGLILRKPG
jgi:SAM-dependent methyltransferase